MLDESQYVISFLISVLLYEYVFGTYSSVPASEVSRLSWADHISKCGDISLIAEIFIFDFTPNLFSGFEERIYWKSKLHFSSPLKFDRKHKMYFYKSFVVTGIFLILLDKTEVGWDDMLM